MQERNDGYFQISLMNVFRQAARERDAKKTSSSAQDEDGRVLSSRSLERREGASQRTLRDHLALDLASLMGTINLESVEDIEGLEFVQKSILNFGMPDLTRFTDEDVRRHRLAGDLKRTLLAHEPRLVPETLVVKLRSESVSSKNHHIAFDVSAEMAAKPVDVPMEFVAEIDAGMGKVSLSNLVVRG